MHAESPTQQLTVAADAASMGARLGRAFGYRVAGAGVAGVIAGVPQAGRPPRPLVLVVRDGNCARFVSIRRVADVSSHDRRVVLRPKAGP
jgi:hypothetical protein